MSRNGRNNVLIGLPDLAKERKLLKIVINRKYTNLINSKLISEIFASDKTVFLCINATQV